MKKRTTWKVTCRIWAFLVAFSFVLSNVYVANARTETEYLSDGTEFDFEFPDQISNYWGNWIKINSYDISEISYGIKLSVNYQYTKFGSRETKWDTSSWYEIRIDYTDGSSSYLGFLECLHPSQAKLGVKYKAEVNLSYFDKTPARVWFLSEEPAEWYANVDDSTSENNDSNNDSSNDTTYDEDEEEEEEEEEDIAPPAKITLISAKNVKTRSIKVSWKTGSGAVKYEVSYSLKKSFSGAKTKTTANTNYTIKNLKKGKTYYVRVRGYVFDEDDEPLYGAWSVVKNIKIKK